jgi:acyl carrier protein
VKIRGFRIEPGEITAVLLTHPLAAQAEVIVREDRPGEKQLVAYVVPAERDADVSSTLRRFLSEALPHYLVPSAWVILNEMPLTPNGKINRSALPAPSREDGSVEHAEPVSDMERKIAAIWCDLLHLEKVGRDQRFFDIGGHSLLLIELQSKLKTVFDRDVPMLDLFRHSTVSQLARYLGDVQDVGRTAATAEHARRLRGGRLRLRELKRERRQANE